MEQLHKFTLFKEYHKTSNAGTQNTGGAAEHPGTVAEQWNTPEHQRNTPEYQRNNNVTPTEHPEQRNHTKQRNIVVFF